MRSTLRLLWAAGVQDSKASMHTQNVWSSCVRVMGPIISMSSSRRTDSRKRMVMGRSCHSKEAYQARAKTRTKHQAQFTSESILHTLRQEALGELEIV